MAALPRTRAATRSTGRRHSRRRRSRAGSTATLHPPKSRRQAGGPFLDREAGRPAFARRALYAARSASPSRSAWRSGVRLSRSSLRTQVGHDHSRSPRSGSRPAPGDGHRLRWSASSSAGHGARRGEPLLGEHSGRGHDGPRAWNACADRTSSRSDGARPAGPGRARSGPRRTGSPWAGSVRSSACARCAWAATARTTACSRRPPGCRRTGPPPRRLPEHAQQPRVDQAEQQLARARLRPARPAGCAGPGSPGRRGRAGSARPSDGHVQGHVRPRTATGRRPGGAVGGPGEDQPAGHPGDGAQGPASGRRAGVSRTTPAR